MHAPHQEKKYARSILRGVILAPSHLAISPDALRFTVLQDSGPAAKSGRRGSGAQ